MVMDKAMQRFVIVTEYLNFQSKLSLEIDFILTISGNLWIYITELPFAKWKYLD